MLQLKKLETLLLKNWTSFIDIRSFTNYVLSLVSKAHFEVVDSDNKIYPNIQIKLSRFDWQERIIWVEFIAPKQPGTAIGTCELFINEDGSFHHNQTTGVIIPSIHHGTMPD